MRVRKNPGGGGLEYFFCGGTCDDSDFSAAGNKVSLPGAYNNKIPSSVNERYLVVFQQKGGVSGHEIDVQTGISAAGVLCVKGEGGRGRGRFLELSGHA